MRWVAAWQEHVGSRSRHAGAMDVARRLDGLRETCARLEQSLQEQNWELQQVRGMVLALRADDSESRSESERDMGDLRRALAAMVSRAEQFEQTRMSMSELLAEVERLSLRLDLTQSVIATLTDQEGSVRRPS